jgi:hypothetical protein
MSGGNTHYAVIVFGGDPASEHPDPELRGRGPSLDLIAAGPAEFCWEALARWTAEHPLRLWEEAEVLARDPLIALSLATGAER